MLTGRAAGNLSLGVGDDAAQVRARRQAVLDATDASTVILPTQVHGRGVVVVDPHTPDGITADALVTREPGILLGITVADCVPVILVDAEAGVVGVVHAGRAGMQLDIVGAAVDAMRALGAQQLDAVVGPSVCARCYEVPEDLRAAVMADVPISASVSRTGTPALDIAAGVLTQLHPRVRSIDLIPGCTAESPDLFSHRASGGTDGRFAAFCWLGGWRR